MTTGAGSAFPVWSRVSSSKPSSRVPKPPGMTTYASDSFMSMSLRVKKYRISTSLGSWAMNVLADCSRGSRMFTPIERSRPAPSMPAAMMPGPAPVTTIQSAPAIVAASSRVHR